MKHEAWELKQMQAVPLESKIVMTRTRIKQWRDYWQGDIYLSFSGGKDSTVLQHIIKEMGENIPSVFADTGLEYPEIRRFATERADVVLKPQIRFNEVIKEYGYPLVSKEISEVVQYARSGGEDSIRYKKLFGQLENNGKKSAYCCEKWSYLYDAPFKISARCCEFMKKKPFYKYEQQTGRKPINATMANESRARKNAWTQTGCNAFTSKHPRSAPMSFWTEQDVLQYIKEYNVEYCEVYGDIVTDAEEKLKTSGCSRTGCIFCAFGCHLEKHPNRFQRLKQTHSKQYEYCMNGGHFEDGNWTPDENGLGLRFVLDYIGVEY